MIRGVYQLQALVVCKDSYTHKVHQYDGADWHVRASIMAGFGLLCVTRDYQTVDWAKCAPKSNEIFIVLMIPSTLQIAVSSQKYKF